MSVYVERDKCSVRFFVRQLFKIALLGKFDNLYLFLIIKHSNNPSLHLILTFEYKIILSFAERPSWGLNLRGTITLGLF